MGETAPILHVLDSAALHMLGPLAAIILLSGLEDVCIYFAWLWLRLRKSPALRCEAGPVAERRMAIFLPLWREHDVILDMLANNIGSLRYSNYEIFAGLYPNDALTREALGEAQRRWPNLRIATCPHDGPTSKADCLNWIYQRMLLYEEQSGGPRFDTIVIHDAEDVIHPDELRTINAYAGQYDFVQIPVLPMPTPALDLTHGIYCDEFAQTHTIDLPVRAMLGGFVPSAGVGTGYSRAALDRLAEAESNRVFDPACLTEDYDNGFRLRALGARQVFLPLSRSRAGPLATREYFPRTWRAALRQRTRWITGIALQGWERHGWSGGWQAYWWWRDRKGLLGTPSGALSCLVFLYAAASRLWTRASIPEWLAVCLAMTLPLQILRSAVHVACSSRWFGLRFGLLAPVREVYSTWLNTVATLRALANFTYAKWRRRPLVWVKTEHAYPSRAALVENRRLLGEILTGSLYLTPAELDTALKSKPPRTRLGEWLVRLGMLTEEELYEALSIQSGVPLGIEAIDRIQAPAARTIPQDVARQWCVVPFEIRHGELHVAGPEPAAGMEFALGEYTSLRIRFHLVTPREFQELERKLSEG